MPEPIDGHDSDPVVEAICNWPGVEHVAGSELVAEAVAQDPQPGRVAIAGFLVGFHLESDDVAVEGFDDEIDLRAVACAPMSDVVDVVMPGRLLEEFADDESFRAGGRTRRAWRRLVAPASPR